jgi:hypothetical protein
LLSIVYHLLGVNAAVILHSLDCALTLCVVQAMDRVHRIGQTRPVRVLRFIMKDSLEERMLILQESKAALGKGALEKLSPEEKRKARIRSLMELFNVDVEEVRRGDH